MTELQAKLLKLLKVTDELCRKYEVDYYLLGGSLIGAMRHGGFIPWDDDADVIMSRDNWEKFYYATKDNLPEGYKISSQYDDINVAMPINRLTETNTTGLFRYHLAAPEVAGTQIDIFVMDPVPDTEEDRELYRNAIAEYSELSALHVSYAYRFGKNTNFKRNWERSLKEGKKKVLEEIVEKAFHYTEEESQLYAQRFAGAPHFWPKEVFGKPQYVPFEDTLLPIPERPGDCLVIGYDDDWRYVPRSGSNLSTHEFAVRSYTTPSHVIWDDYISHIDNKELIDAFVGRKYDWERQFDERFQLECEIQKFAVEKVKYKYKKKLENTDISKLVKERSFDVLREIFAEYIDVQSNNMLVGSASLTGRIQYYRRNHPLLIDIGDEALDAVIRCLIHYQRLGVAAKIMNARNCLERTLTSELKEDNEAINRIRRIVSTYGVGEFEECRRLTDEGLAIEPLNPFYVKHDIFLKVRECDDEPRNRETIQKGLDLFADDSELLMQMAESYRREGLLDECLKIYDYLISSTDDGIVLRKIREHCQELYEQSGTEENYDRWMKSRERSGEKTKGISFGEEEESRAAESDKEDDEESDTEPVYEDMQEEPVDAVQSVRFELLEELRDICDNNNLDYYICGNALLQAMKGDPCSANKGPLAVMMNAEDAIKFQDIVNKGKRTDRIVESMLTNPEYFRMCMKYCNTETLDFSINNSYADAHPAIGIIIEILRPVESNMVSTYYNRMLEKGWEAKTGGGRIDRNTFISENYLKLLSKIKGTDNIAKSIFAKLTKGSDKNMYQKSEEVFIKTFSGRRRYFKSEWFKEKKEVALDNMSFTTASRPDKIMAVQRGDGWIKKDYAGLVKNEFARILDTELPCDEYRDALEAAGIDVKDFQQRWKISRQEYKSISKVTKLASKHWYFLAVCGERQNLYDQYRDLKPTIMEAYNERNVEKVGALIKDYYDKAIEYVSMRLALYFDRDLFEVLVWYIAQKGPQKDVIPDLLISYQEEQQWSDKQEEEK